MNHECVEEQSGMSWKRRALIVGALIIGLALIEGADDDSNGNGTHFEQQAPQQELAE